MIHELRPIFRARGGRALCAAAATALVLVAMPARAGLDLQPQRVEDLPQAEVPVVDGAIELSLDRALDIALARNLGLVVERYNWVRTDLGVLQSLGIYDPALSGGASYSDSTQPSAQRIEGVPELSSKSTGFQLRLEQLVPYGGRATIEVSGNRNDTNSQNSVLNPIYSGGQTLRYNQPLLRGFGRVQTEQGIIRARYVESQARQSFLLQVMTLLQDVETGYWNLVEARNQLEVAKEALRLAQVLHDQNKVRVEVGTVAPLELTQSKAGIANREEGIIQAEAAIGDAEDRLRQLLNLEDGQLWSLPIVPKTTPDGERVEVRLEEALGVAVDSRPEMATQRIALERLKLEATLAQNATLPDLSVGVSYGLSGLSGKGAALLPINGDFSDVGQQIVDRDFDSWSISVGFAYSLLNREAKALKAIADYEVDKGQAEMSQLQQQIVTEVRTAVRRVQTTAKQIDSARVSRELEEQNLDAERKRYENGMSSSFQVLQIQEDLTEARSREVQAVTAYRRALADLEKATGRGLAARGLELKAPGM
jgi:outer membrane protein TolC